MAYPKLDQHSDTHSQDAERQPDSTDEDMFLGLDEAETILASLEEQDRRMLSASRSDMPEYAQDEEGSFISPEELETHPQSFSRQSEPKILPRETEPRTITSSSPRQLEGVQSDLLTRIAGELRSIKSDLGTLKTTYDEMIEKGNPAHSESNTPAAPPQDAGTYLSAETYEEVRKLFGYLDRLLESLPEEKIDEFASSEYFDLYRKIFELFGLT